MTSGDTGDLFQDIEPLTRDPILVLGSWLSRARETGAPDADAMALATVDARGRPDLRVVTLSTLSRGGLIFFTNIESAKGLQLKENPHAAVAFHWRETGRQVRVRGIVQSVSEDEADAYFASSPREIKIAAIASDQSRPLDARRTLMRQAAQVATVDLETSIKRPQHWGGFRLVPSAIEFWQKADDRLHDRIRFTREGDSLAWRRGRLYP